MTRLLDWEDRATAVLFGDGGGAVVLEATDINAESEPHIIGSYLRSDGNLTDLLYVDGGPSTTGTTGKLRMQGREVYRHAVGNIAEAINSLLQRHELTVDDIDWFVPHQANKRIIDGVAKKIGLPAEKTVVTVQNHANTSAASIPLALARTGQKWACVIRRFDYARSDGRRPDLGCQSYSLGINPSFNYVFRLRR